MKMIRSVLCLSILIVSTLGMNLFMVEEAVAGVGDLIDIDHSDWVATTGDNFDFSVNASGYDKVEVAYYFGSDNSTWVNMSGSGTIYSHNITVPSNSTDTLHYWFIGTYRINGTDLQDTSSLVNMTVTDNDQPVLGDDNTLSKAYFSTTFQLNISNVTDNLGIISSISVEITAYSIGGSEVVNETKSSFKNHNGHYLLNYTGHNDIAMMVYPRMEFWYRFIISDGPNDLTTQKRKIVIIDDFPPNLYADFTPLTGFTTGDIWHFSVGATDSCEITSCTLKVNESGMIGTQTNSESSSNIDSYFYYEGASNVTGISYWFIITDEFNNVLITDPSSRTIVDNDKPMLDVDQTHNTTYTGNTLSFSVNLTDNIGIDKVHINYTCDNTTWHNVTMKNDTATNWYHNITVPHGLSPIWYIVNFNDTADNWANSTQQMVQVLDDDPPEFINDHSLPSTTTGEPYEFKAEIRDNIGVQEVWVDYGYGENPWENVSMSRSEGDNWTVTIDIMDNTEPLYYSFHFNDTSDNWNSSEEETTDIHDNDLPYLNVDNTPGIAIMGQQLTFQLDYQDNIDVQEAWVEYSYGDGPMTNLSMSEGGQCDATIDILDILEDIHYSFHFSDDSGNWNQTTEKTITVFDHTLPIITEDLSDKNATTGDNFEIQLFAYDNIEVASVRVLYRFGSGDTQDINLTYNSTEGKWKKFLIMPHSLERFHYVIYVNDTSGNENNSTEFIINITDNDRPFLVEDLSPAKCTTGDTYLFLFNITDNIDIVGAFVEYWFDSEHLTVELVETAFFSADISIPSNSIVPLTFRVHYNDTFNRVITEERSVNVVDNDLPEVAANFSDVSARTGELVRFSFVVSDNIGISTIFVKILGGPIPTTNINLTLQDGYYNGTIEVPNNAFGPISYQMFVEDLAGNSLTTPISNITVFDIIHPTIDSIDDMTVYANHPFEIDVYAFDNIGISDMMFMDHYYQRNGTNFTITLAEPGIHNLTIMVIDAAGNNATLTFRVEVLPENHDMDGDGMPDLYEIGIGLDPNDAMDNGGDPDQDNLTNLQEYWNGTDPYDDDTDGDGMKDGIEIFYGLDPLNSIDANQDSDSDGTSNLDEILRGTDPTIDEIEDPIDDPVDGKEDNDLLIPLIAGISLAFLLIIFIVLMIKKSRGGILVGRGSRNRRKRGDANVFISYSSKDEDTALSICANLERREIKCWIAPRDILSGESYGGSIVNAINNSQVMILIYSKNSNVSPQVIREVERAVSKKIKIIPVRIDNSDLSSDMEYFISSSHWLDATTPPIEKHIDKIEDSVKGILAEQGYDPEE